MSEIEERLQELRDDGLYRRMRLISGPQGPRVLLDGKPVLLLCSNNYLGLADHPRVREAAAAAAMRWGVGAGASRLVSGNMTVHRRLEERLAEFKGAPRCVLFGSGYLANAGIVSALAREGDVVFSDELNHASLVDGCRLAKARTFVYRHRDVEHLEWGLAEAQGRGSLIVTDGVFSMDGDVAPLTDIVELARRYDTRVMVDEAHATGTFGPEGRGTVAEAGLEDEVDLVVGTLGKALGAYGAYACCDQAMARYLVNSVRTLIYSTALPPPVAAAAMAALELLEQQPRLVERVQRNAEVMRQALAGEGLRTGELAHADTPARHRRPGGRRDRLAPGARARRLRAGDPSAHGPGRHRQDPHLGHGLPFALRAPHGRAHARRGRGAADPRVELRRRVRRRAAAAQRARLRPSGLSLNGLFVTGTGTGVGKSVVAAATCAALARDGRRVAAYKPVVTGLDEASGDWPPDHELLADAANAGQAPEDVAPYRFGPPVSPHHAAELAGSPVDTATLVRAARAAAAGADVLVAEGVGGLLVPLTPGYLVRDLAVDLGLPVVVAAESGLGTINHSLLTVEAARVAGLAVAGVVMTPWPERPSAMARSNRDTVERVAGVSVRGLPETSLDRLADAGAALPISEWLSATTRA